MVGYATNQNSMSQNTQKFNCHKINEFGVGLVSLSQGLQHPSQILLFKSLMDKNVPELEEIHHPVSISNVMTTVVENRRSRENNITSTALLPYYIDPMIIGQQDATIVINVREVVRPTAQDAMEFIFPTPTKVNWRYWGLHSTHKERRIRMGLFMGLADSRPMKEDIIHWDGIQVD